MVDRWIGDRWVAVAPIVTIIWGCGGVLKRPRLALTNTTTKCTSAEEFSTAEKISVLFALVNGGIARTVIDESSSPEPMDKNTKDKNAKRWWQSKCMLNHVNHVQERVGLASMPMYGDCYV